MSKPTVWLATGRERLFVREALRARKAPATVVESPGTRTNKRSLFRREEARVRFRPGLEARLSFFWKRSAPEKPIGVLTQ